MNRAIDILKLIVSIVVSQLAGVIGSIFTTRAIPTWYAELERPWFSPPSWLFGPVWVTLYVLMGIAAWLVWRQGIGHREVRIGLTLFAVQLVLNVLWSYVFFGRQAPLEGFMEILLLWLAILLTIIAFFRRSKPAGWLMVPYILWVSFAAVLNYFLWQLNA